MSKTILVTGGNRGIGLATVKGLAAEGHHVLLGCRNVEAGEKAASEIDGNISVVKLDMSNQETMTKQVTVIIEAHPQIDALVNNAAILEEGNFLEVDEDAFYRSVQVNFLSVFKLIRLLTPQMMDRGYGRIVNLSSGWGSFGEGLGGPAAYSITKAALNAITLTLAHSLPKNVKANSMCPGWVRTEMGGPSATRSPEEGAETAIWLATLPDNGPSGGFFRDKNQIPW